MRHLPLQYETFTFMIVGVRTSLNRQACMAHVQCMKPRCVRPKPSGMHETLTAYETPTCMMLCCVRFFYPTAICVKVLPCSAKLKTSCTFLNSRPSVKRAARTAGFASSAAAPRPPQKQNPTEKARQKRHCSHYEHNDFYRCYYFGLYY